MLDFGLAKVTEREMRPGSIILTQEGMVFGTPEFMSPEQAQGKTLTPASDIYSLAVILYEVLTGKLPFDAKTPMEYIQLHVTGKPTPLSQRVAGKTFPPLLDQIIARCLSKKIEDRFASLADLAAALQCVLEGKRELPSGITPVPAMAMAAQPSSSPMAAPMQGDDPPTRADIPKSNAGLLVGVAVACLLAGVVLTVVFMTILRK